MSGGFDPERTGPSVVAGVVPAAGLSTRMGRSKPLLDAGGRSFLQRVVAALAGGGCDPVVVVVRDDDGPEADLGRETGAEVVVNPDPSDGPVSSLRAALRSLSRRTGTELEGCAFCPVDHPRIDAETVSRLREAFLSSDAPVVVPRHESHRGHPVFFRHTLFQELLEEGLPEGARTVVRRHADQVLEVDVDDAGVLVDIDTPGEYRRHYPSESRTPDRSP